MQVSSAVTVHQSFNSCSGTSTEFQEITAKFEDVFSSKLRLESFKNKKPPQEPEQEEQQEQEQTEEEEEEEEEEEFSFACTNPDGSPISADDVFQNGQIRPFFPLFNRDLLFSDEEAKTTSASTPFRPPLRKLFFEERDHASSTESEEPEGPCCEWTGKAKETSPEVCRKSNSTGFSKLRRFRELVLRSNSDGKDAFVFLHHHSHNHNKKEKEVTVKKEKKKKRSETASSSSSAHEKLYVRNRAVKEEHKRKSYLPYRVGFFANVNGLSRNVHPY